MNGTHYLVKYGPKREYLTYFPDRAKAEHYVNHHENAVIVVLKEQSDVDQSNTDHR
ncbi:hypothetical protein M8A51_25650 [Schlegelella sp. S2-27]|uniref:DUF1330 domain-containing protein n=1 Tax=Caldimonas mangrovi TaxID=2944811 RepID=A0ABT0YX22_9BURK|nr:hypothetical protein [Caldimonas mangrovi]MCM5682922.1 hypothetical protein [Caldimonas mangrovi]